MRKGDLAAIIDLNEQDDQIQPLAAARPIGTLPFAGRYRLLDFPLSSLDRANVRSVAIFLPKSGRSVMDHIGSGSTWNMDQTTGRIYTYPYMAVRDYDDPQLRARYFDDYLQFLRKSNSKYTIIMDTQDLANIDIDAIVAYHNAGESMITTVYKNQPEEEMQPDDLTLDITGLGTASSVVPASDNRGHLKKGKVPAFMGIYLISTTDLIELFTDAAKAPAFKRLPQIMREAVMQNNANAFEYTGFLAKINTIQRYFDANMSMLTEKNYQALLYSTNSIETKSKNEIPTFYSTESKVTNSLLGTGNFIEGEVSNSIIFRNVHIHHDAQVDHSIVMQDSKIDTGSTVKYAILDKGVVIGPNLAVEGTPEAPLVFAKNQKVFQPDGQGVTFRG
jgi:glucose-1-phosphate adenylyltransferase